MDLAVELIGHLETVVPEVRIDESLPILDESGAVVTPEEFDRFKAVWEGHRAPSRELHTDRKLDKRIDHRHHLIDAITIALTSRSLFQQMARDYKLESERANAGERPRLEVPEPPLRNVRDLALNAVRECRVSIKPDRFPDGAMFGDTAYGAVQRGDEDKLRLTQRKAIASFIDRKSGTADQARKAIATIVSPRIRDIVSKLFETRLLAGKTAPAALAEPFHQDIYGKAVAINKVRCYTGKYADDVAVVGHISKDGKVHTKRLANNGFAYLESLIENGGVVRQELVT